MEYLAALCYNTGRLIAEGCAMNSRQIECMLEVGKELNYTKAAKNLFLTQPAVSRYIASLEKELGTHMFARTGSRRIALTEDGKIYYDFFSRAAAEFQGIQATVRRSEKYLRLGYPAGWNTSPFLPAVMERCRQTDPGLSVSLTCLELQPLLQALTEDRLDAVLIPEDHAAEKHIDLELTRITGLRRVIAFSEKLLGGTAHSLADFAGLDFFVPDDELARRQCQNVLRPCASGHFTPRLVPKANMETVLACVENGLGAAVLDEWCRVLTHPDVHNFALDSRQPVCLARKAGTDHPHVRALQNTLQDYFCESGV